MSLQDSSDSVEEFDLPSNEQTIAFVFYSCKIFFGETICY